MNHNQQTLPTSCNSNNFPKINFRTSRPRLEVFDSINKFKNQTRKDALNMLIDKYVIEESNIVMKHATMKQRLDAVSISQTPNKEPAVDTSSDYQPPNIPDFHDHYDPFAERAL
jgi:hypothetical protein